jgi:hypothetical protein
VTCVLEGAINHLPCGFVKDEVGFVLGNAVSQAIVLLHAKEN